jgi:hypothetical protein
MHHLIYPTATHTGTLFLVCVSLTFGGLFRGRRTFFRAAYYDSLSALVLVIHVTKSSVATTFVESTCPFYELPRVQFHLY